MDAESTPSAVGALLNGTYRLERVIAEGGMGIVYEAAHVRLPRRFAVKVLGRPGEAKIGSTQLQRFRREAEIASTLAHPHIVEVFDYQVAESGAPYLVMELLEGEDLADRLKRGGRLPIPAAMRIIGEIAEALDCAHTGGVVHRDLKPANIFLSKRGAREDFVKVLDFGVSKLIDAATLTQEKAMVGTPLYMSPEQAVGTQELSPASDVFSLGSIAFEMLTGRRAFAASSIPSILYQIVHGPTPAVAGRAPGLSSAVDVVFARVLAKKKEDRYARASLFAEELRQALDRRSGPVAIVEAVPELIEEDDAQAPPADDEPRAPTGEAAATEIDASTQAEEAMEAAARADQPPPSLAPEAPGPPSVVVDLRPSRRGWWLGSGLVLAAIGLSVAAWRLATGAHPVTQLEPELSHPSVEVVGAPPAPPAIAPPVAARPPTVPVAAAPVVAPAKAPTVVETSPLAFAKVGPAPTVPKAPPHPADVQFVFHVVPKIATIHVDDRPVRGGQITLPWQTRPRVVKVAAPGYKPLELSAPSTLSRSFELHMEKVEHVKPHTAPKATPAHDAAPVQEL